MPLCHSITRVEKMVLPPLFLSFYSQSKKSCADMSRQFSKMNSFYFNE
jgi:hypothetical protein